MKDYLIAPSRVLYNILENLKKEEDSSFKELNLSAEFEADLLRLATAQRGSGSELKRQTAPTEDVVTKKPKTNEEVNPPAAVVTAEQQRELVCNPIGYLKSVFRECNACPRQGNIVPHSRAHLRILEDCSPPSCFADWGASHCWVLFEFHHNKNKAARSISKDASKASRTRGKVAPPRLGGKRVGMFSTRTPHRPNPIGLSLAKVEGFSADRKTIILSGIDLVDGTPILDIKPYLPRFDSAENATIPNWLTDVVEEIEEVVVSESVNTAIKKFFKKSAFFSSETELIHCLKETLIQEIRSISKIRKQPHAPHWAWIDKFNFLFVTKDMANGKKAIVVYDVKYWPKEKPDTHNVEIGEPPSDDELKLLLQ